MERRQVLKLLDEFKQTPPPEDPGSLVEVLFDVEDEPVLYVRDYKGCWFPTLTTKKYPTFGGEGIKEQGWRIYPNPDWGKEPNPTDTHTQF